MYNILICDDQPDIVNALKIYLTPEGYNLFEAFTGQQAANIVKDNDIHLILLDIMMPEIDGWEVCRKIRETSGVPIMLVSARSQDFDQIMGFENGADDYVTKPFSLAILSRRINTLLQRGEVQKPTKPESDRIFEYDGLEVNSVSYEVRLNGQLIELTLKEYEILKMFVKSPGRVYSREKILLEIWGEDFEGELRNIDSHIARIRTKLGDWGTQKLVTVYGTGYKLGE